MRRRLMFMLGWALATAITVSASWLGIRSMLVAAAPDLAVPLSAADLRTAGRAATPSPSPTPGASKSPQRDPESTQTSPSPQGTTASPPGHPTGGGAWVRGAGGVHQRDFELVGGDVAVTFDDGKLAVDAIEPAAGYRLSHIRWSDSSVTIAFKSSKRVSKVFLDWRDGAPYTEVTESS